MVHLCFLSKKLLSTLYLFSLVNCEEKRVIISLIWHQLKRKTKIIKWNAVSAGVLGQYFLRQSLNCQWSVGKCQNKSDVIYCQYFLSYPEQPDKGVSFLLYLHGANYFVLDKNVRAVQNIGDFIPCRLKIYFVIGKSYLLWKFYYHCRRKRKVQQIRM